MSASYHRGGGYWGSKPGARAKLCPLRSTPRPRSHPPQPIRRCSLLDGWPDAAAGGESGTTEERRPRVFAVARCAQRHGRLALRAKRRHRGCYRPRGTRPGRSLYRASYGCNRRPGWRGGCGRYAAIACSGASHEPPECITVHQLDRLALGEGGRYGGEPSGGHLRPCLSV